jgi:enoyl-CoA hydratase
MSGTNHEPTVVADDAPLLVDTRDRRMILTLNRPLALLDAYERFDNDDDLGVLILRGAGRAFSAGADLKEASWAEPDLSPWEIANRRRLGMVHFDRLEQVRKPTIACIHGYAVGGGLELALCADIRIATVDARLGTPEARTFGGMPAVAVHRLGRLIPHGEAMRILLTSQPIAAERAHAIGLVQELATDVDDMARIADELADQILECSPEAIASIKQIARWHLDAGTANSQTFATHARPTTEATSNRPTGAAFLAGRDRRGRHSDDI